MIHELDEVLQQLLERELPYDNGGVHVTFDQPTREWSSRQPPPTLNLFLHDIRENHILRRPDYELAQGNNGVATKQRAATRLDLHYLVTAWANTPEDEHRLLNDFLMAFLRYPTLSLEKLAEIGIDVPESIENQPEPIPMRLARHDELNNPAEIWGVLDNELRPAISCVVTLALNPYQLIESTMVRTVEWGFNPQGTPLSQPRDPKARAELERFWRIGGAIRSQQPFKNVKLKLVERGLEVPVRLIGQKKDEPVNEARFIIRGLEAGTYTLEVWVDDGQPPHGAPAVLAGQRQITVPNDPHQSPAETYDIEI